MVQKLVSKNINLERASPPAKCDTYQNAIFQLQQALIFLKLEGEDKV